MQSPYTQIEERKYDDEEKSDAGEYMDNVRKRKVNMSTKAKSLSSTFSGDEMMVSSQLQIDSMIRIDDFCRGGTKMHMKQCVI